MLRYVLIVAWSWLLQAQATVESPRIIIVGAGASGIAAACRLMQNGFNNITILEAENRIGGRVYTTDFGGYKVDVGGQWVHGEEGSASFEMAWPLGLIERSVDWDDRIYSSANTTITDEVGIELLNLYNNITESSMPEEYMNGSTGEFIKLRFNEYFDAHPNLATERASLIDMFDVLNMNLNAADTWDDISPNGGYVPSAGDEHINWKDRGYSTILDILMKKYPNPGEELPVMNSTVLNAEVSRINYDPPGGGVQVVTSKGDEYTADHVIVTASVAVLQHDYKTMFDPRLPERKINAIKRLQLGNAVKIILLYDEPWWTGESGMILHWSAEDRKKIENDPEKSWLLGVVTIHGIAHRPRLLMCWVVGRRAKEMETAPDDRIFSQTKETLRKFFGTTHNLTEPTAMLRSQWYSNKHFRGTWSYRSPEFVNSDSKVADLVDPIMRDGKSVLQFAGEASHPTQYGTVHGAIATGWREADRLKALYPDVKS